MKLAKKKLSSAFAAAIMLALSGCVTTTGGGQANQSSDTAASQPAPAKAAPEQSKTPPGMNDKGEVIDPTKVEEGHSKRIKGQGDWEGEIIGKPVKGSKFTKLKIGMSLREVTSLAGAPTDQGAYITGKAFIPFYYGSDKHRYEMLYKGHGRLIFAGGAMGDYTGGHLIWVIHSANEGGYR